MTPTAFLRTKLTRPISDCPTHVAPSHRTEQKLHATTWQRATANRRGRARFCKQCVESPTQPSHRSARTCVASPSTPMIQSPGSVISIVFVALFSIRYPRTLPIYYPRGATRRKEIFRVWGGGGGLRGAGSGSGSAGRASVCLVLAFLPVATAQRYRPKKRGERMSKQHGADGLSRNKGLCPLRRDDMYLPPMQPPPARPPSRGCVTPLGLPSLTSPLCFFFLPTATFGRFSSKRDKSDKLLRQTAKETSCECTVL